MTASPFRHCPSCLHPEPQFRDRKHLYCDHCGFEFFQNTAAAVGAIIRKNDLMLFLKRGREPGYGLLDIPGGFVDPGETLEEALRRECMEEIGLELVSMTYFCSQSNQYLYGDVQYSTADAFFLAQPAAASNGVEDPIPFQVDHNEIQSVHWIRLSDIKPEDLAFASLRLLYEKLVLSS